MSPIWNIVAAELEKAEAASVGHIYQQVTRLPKDEQRAAVRELIRAVVELKRQPRTTTVVLVGGRNV